MSGAAAAAPMRLAADADHDAPPAPRCARPLVGIAAVLLGAVISTLFTRVTSFGLADLRGAVHAGVDEGAWITTATTVGQMSIGPLAAWLALVFGVRRVLMVSAGVFFLMSALTPFAANLQHPVRRGTGARAFVRHLHSADHQLRAAKPAAALGGLRHRGLRAEFGTVAEHSGFAGGLLPRSPVMALDLLAGQHPVCRMLACIHFGMPNNADQPAALRHVDAPGIVYPWPASRCSTPASTRATGSTGSIPA